jgi:hypothetical protein
MPNAINNIPLMRKNHQCLTLRLNMTSISDIADIMQTLPGVNSFTALKID